MAVDQQRCPLVTPPPTHTFRPCFGPPLLVLPPTPRATRDRFGPYSSYAAHLWRQVVDLEALKKLSWNGVPGRWRPTVWQLLLAYLPSDRKRREQTVARKRREYAEAASQYFESGGEEYRTPAEQSMLRQILVDVPRTSPDVPLFHQQPIQRCLERLLFVWALRHPASGYVQGMNDLATPLLVVFLSAALVDEDPDDTPSQASGSHGRCILTAAVESLDAAKLPAEALAAAEADTYWCLTKLLDNIQVRHCHGSPSLSAPPSLGSTP